MCIRLWLETIKKLGFLVQTHNPSHSGGTVRQIASPKPPWTTEGIQGQPGQLDDTVSKCKKGLEI